MDKYFWIESGAQFEDHSGRKGIAITPPYEDISGKTVFVGRYIDDGLARVLECSSVLSLEINFSIGKEEGLALQKELELVFLSQTGLTHLSKLKDMLDVMLCRPRS